MTLLRKKIYSLLAIASFFVNVNGQVFSLPFSESFDYPENSTLPGQGHWVSEGNAESGLIWKTLRQKLFETSDTVLVFSHRALHLSEEGGSIAAENSMTAINKAIDNHVDGFECDVRKTADGVLVLMHDATVDRTTNGTGAVSDMSYESLRTLRLKMYGTDEVTDDTIPTLGQVLRIAKGKIYITLDIESKAPVSDVLTAVKEAGMVDDVIFFTKSSSSVSYLLENGAIPLPSCYNNSTYNNYAAFKIIPQVYQSDNGGYTQEWALMKAAENKIYDNVYLLTSTLPTTDNWAILVAALQNGVNIVQTDYPVEMINYLKNENKH